jgi:hypothetical protein
MTDLAMESAMFAAQQEDHPSSSPHAGLDQPSSSLLERGECSGHISKSNLSTMASLHPFIAGGLFAAGVGLAYAGTRRFRSNGTEGNED